MFIAQASVVPTGDSVCIPALQALRQDRMPRKARHSAVHMQVHAAAATEQVQDGHATFGATVSPFAAVRSNNACSNSLGLKALVLHRPSKQRTQWTKHQPLS